MATPDYLDQVVVSGRRRTSAGGDRRTRSGLLYRPSVTSLIWATLDFLTVGIAALLALRFRAGVGGDLRTMSLPVFLRHEIPPILFAYVAWYGLMVVILARSYGLYGALLSRSGLNEQRMTVQASLVAGLLLCGTLYLAQAEMVSRVVVILLVVFTTLLLCVRRAIWRKVVYSRYREGLETRNVLIVGAGRVAHALRNHLESLRHLGFRRRRRSW
jgi:FlaA1/EpsC-like NDP-sugar epimerase